MDTTSDSFPSRNPLRVRFAPSPTGHLHIGGARTALFNWLFARHQGGVFILRIEDSDRKRSSSAMVDEIMEEMKWLGLDWDEGPFFQSDRADLYREYAHRLREEGKAYETLSSPGKGTAIVYRVNPGEEIAFSDLIRGKIKVDTKEIKDLVLLKSDGTPAYNFACVVDDHQMGISHVIRGEDHVTNTPKQLLIYRALNWNPPRFAHLPLILESDKTPLSKRHGATSLKAFREAGFLPDALLNYLALLGWSPGDNREFMTTEEIITRFSLQRVIKRAAVFDYRKLLWLNGKYMRQIPPEELARMAGPFLEKAIGGSGKLSGEKILKVVKILGARMKTLPDLARQGKYFFLSDIDYAPEAVGKYWGNPGVANLLANIKKELSVVEPFCAPELEKKLRGLIVDLNVEISDLIHPLRVAVTGQPDSPGIFEILEVLGKETTLSRLDKALEYLTN